MSDKKISQLPAIVTIDDADVIPVNDVSEGDPSLINKKMTLQQFQTHVGKIDQATGYTLAGGTSSKTLTLSEDSTIDQDLQQSASPSFSGATLTNRLDFTSTGTMDSTTGASFFGTNDDYRIGFDGQGGTVGYLRYNIDVADAIHCHAWTVGAVGNPISLLACLRGDGLFAIGNHTPESRIDSGEDIRVGEISTPSNPTSGIKIYSKSDNKLYALNDAGLEVELTSPGAVSSVFGRVGVVVSQNGDYTTSQVTEGTNLYFTNSRALSACEKVNSISGYEISGGSPNNRTLSVTEDSTIDQNLSTLSNVQHAQVSNGSSFTATLDFTGTTLVGMPTEGGSITGPNMANSQIQPFMDETTDVLTFKTKNSSGTVTNYTLPTTIGDTTKLTLDHNNSPGTPAAGKVTIFAKTDNDFWQIDSSGASRNLAVSQEDGIISTAVDYQALVTDTLIKVDVTSARAIQLDAATLGRQPVTIMREIGLGTTLAITGINGTTLRAGTASVANSLYASVTYIKMSSNEMIQIANNA